MYFFVQYETEIAEYKQTNPLKVTVISSVFDEQNPWKKLRQLVIGNHTRPCLNINHNPDSQMYKLQTEILTLFVFINTLRNEICVRGDKITHKNSWFMIMTSLDN